MLTAYNKLNEKIIARDSIKGEPYFCPACKKDLITRQGKVIIWHFAHKYLGDCYWENESEEHADFKMRLYDYFKGQGYECELEKITTSRECIIDLEVRNKRGVKVAIEVQLSTYSGENILQKTKTLNELGYYVLWLIGEPGLKIKWSKEEYLTEEDQEELHQDRTSEMLYTMHSILYFGRIYTITKNFIVKAHGGSKIDPEMEISALYLKYRTKTIIKERLYLPITDLRLFLTTCNGFKVARFYDKYHNLQKPLDVESWE